MMIAYQINEQNWLRKVHAETKLLLTISYSLVILAINEPLILLITFLASLILLISTKTKIAHSIIKAVMILVVTTIISQAIFYYEYYVEGEGTILIYIIPPDTPIISEITANKGIAIVLEGIFYGINIGLKLAITILISCVFIFTTSISELFSFACKMKIPAKIMIAFIFTLRFVPIVTQEIKRSLIVLKMKGEKTSLGNLTKVIILSLRNVIYSLIIYGYTFAFVLETRCFQWKFPIIIERKNSKFDIVVILISLLPWITFSMILY